MHFCDLLFLGFQNKITAFCINTYYVFIHILFEWYSCCILDATSLKGREQRRRSPLLSLITVSLLFQFAWDRRETKMRFGFWQLANTWYHMLVMTSYIDRSLYIMNLPYDNMWCQESIHRQSGDSNFNFTTAIQRECYITYFLPEGQCLRFRQVNVDQCV